MIWPRTPRNLPLLIGLLGSCACALAAPAQLPRTSSARAGETSPTAVSSAAPADGTRYSPLTQIDTRNVGRLGLAWEFRDFIVRGRTHRGMQSSPLVIGQVMYFSGPWGVAYAVDGRSGRLLWRYDPQADGQYGRASCCDIVNRGLAVRQDRLYIASPDGYLNALDARTGRVLWRVDTFVDHHWNYVITSAPYVAGDKVVIGNAGSDMGARGYVSAYDAATGRLAWRFWSVPGDPGRGPDETPDVTFARRTWASDTRWDLGGGGAVWDSIAYDPEAHLVYFGTGNGDPHPRWLRSPGGGDNLFICSVVAVDAQTGRLKWYYQEVPGDSWDFDATTPLVLADLTIDGRHRPVIMQAAKNGFLYVLDRRTGELLRADPYTYLNWASGVDRKTGRPRLTAHADYSHGPRIIWPSPAGGHGWQPISFDPETRLLYVPVYEAPIRIRAEAPAKFLPGYLNQASTGDFPPYTDAAAREELRGQPEPRIESRLKAWDPARGRMAWQTDAQPFGAGGTLATAGDLVFEGNADGILSAYDARTGRLLLRLPTGTAITAAPISYELDHVQYVAVLAGAGGPQAPRYAPDVAASHYRNFERLLVFRLDGKPTPLPPPVSLPPRQPTPLAVPANEALLVHGETLFHEHCMRCHMVGGAFGEYPDLWNLSPATLEAFDGIVRGGAFRYAGMASFADVLTQADAAAIKAFIVTDERRRRAGRTATTPPTTP